MRLITDTYLFGSGGRRWLPIVLLAPGVFFYFFIAIGPSTATAIYSLTDASGIGGEVNWIGFDNYYEFLLQGLSRRDNLAALTRTLTFSFFVTTIQFGLGLVFALVLNQRLRGRTFFRTIFFMPVILGVVVQGLMWKLFLYPGSGPVAQVFDFLGFGNNFLGGTDAFMWVITVQIWSNVGITMVIFLAGMQAISPQLYDAARIDGAGPWATFRDVTWPQLTPAVNTNLLLNIIGSLQAWQLFLVLIGYKPGTQVLGYLVYAEGFGQTSGAFTTSFRQGFAAAASIVLFILVLILGLGANYFVSRREEKYMS
jgi:raffinose/stachyose/melibiose transport system permease protein